MIIAIPQGENVLKIDTDDIVSTTSESRCYGLRDEKSGEMVPEGRTTVTIKLVNRQGPEPSAWFEKQP